ncbi:hypothetical protein CLM84_28260, partial [Streptomyces albidoflavus]
MVLLALALAIPAVQVAYTLGGGGAATDALMDVFTLVLAALLGLAWAPWGMLAARLLRDGGRRRGDAGPPRVPQGSSPCRRAASTASSSVCAPSLRIAERKYP